MYRNIVFRFVLALVLIGAIIGLGIFAYNAGLAQGRLVNPQIPGGETAAVPLPYYAMPYWHPFFGYGGFGFLGCLIPLFLLFLVFIAFRGLLWGGRRWGHGWNRMHHGPWGEGGWNKDVPPMFQEWHRQAHEGQPTESAGEKKP
jgi:hypothetical protein